MSLNIREIEVAEIERNLNIHDAEQAQLPTAIRDFCTCQNCIVIPSFDENVSCNESDLTVGNPEKKAKSCEIRHAWCCFNCMVGVNQWLLRPVTQCYATIITDISFSFIEESSLADYAMCVRYCKIYAKCYWCSFNGRDFYDWLRNVT